RRGGRAALLDGMGVLGRMALVSLIMESSGGLLPVGTVEVLYRKRRKIDAVDAADVDSPAARIEARPAGRMDAAMSTRVVLRGHRVELVQSQLVLAGGDAEARV